MDLKVKVNDISIFKTTIHLEIKAWFHNRRMTKATIHWGN